MCLSFASAANVNIYFQVNHGKAEYYKSPERRKRVRKTGKKGRMREPLHQGIWPSSLFRNHHNFVPVSHSLPLYYYYYFALEIKSDHLTWLFFTKVNRDMFPSLLIGLTTLPSPSLRQAYSSWHLNGLESRSRGKWDSWRKFWSFISLSRLGVYRVLKGLK